MRWGSRALLLFALAAGGLALRAGEARAQARLDPTYGRVQGDLTLVGAAGAVVADGGARPEAELRVRYLESAGVFVSYEDAAIVSSPAAPQRLLAAGLEVRPFFLFRWLRGLEAQRARFDLVVDSIGLEVAATFMQPGGGAFASRAGVQIGAGIEFPLLPEATGPWIGVHGGVRYSDDLLASGAARDGTDRTPFLAITLAWHQVVLAHVVDVGDQAPR